MKEKKEEERKREDRGRAIDNAIGGDLVGRCSKVLFVFIRGLCSRPVDSWGGGVERAARGKERKKIIQRRGKGVRSTSRYGTVRCFGRKNSCTRLDTTFPTTYVF